ncbi:hypothetical protein BC360_23055 [Ensifer sp. LC163]|nr:hypothetical protein BC361_26425 [Ensifer sp. LC54]OCP37450.1 hypothetical protein BC360_23055 [Ensifer sp. LC163]
MRKTFKENITKAGRSAAQNPAFAAVEGFRRTRHRLGDPSSSIEVAITSAALDFGRPFIKPTEK